MQTTLYNPEIIKKDFPLFKKYPDLVYLDSAATSQKPVQVIRTVDEVYKKNNANVHRGIYSLAEKTTELYEQSRDSVASFIHARDRNEVIFTKNTNESIQLVVSGWAKKNLHKGDIVVLSEMEHHANVIPWLRLKEEIGIFLFFIPIDNDGRLLHRSILTAKLNIKKIKVVSLTYVSNVLGVINPIKKIKSFFSSHGISPKIIIDAAQAVGHIPVDVVNLQCDFLAFSSHKMLGPSGVGVLWGKKELLETMDPLIGGSHSIQVVKKESFTWATIPDRFEPGTPNIEGVIGLNAAISYLKKIGVENIQQYEERIAEYILEKLNSLAYIKLLGPKNIQERLGIFSFTIPGIHPHDIAQILDEDNICVRAGNHCAQILMETLQVHATARASISLYTTKEDIDRFLVGLEKVKNFISKS